MSATYHSFVNTVLLKGGSVWQFFGEFFEDVVTGSKRHLGLLNLAVAETVEVPPSLRGLLPEAIQNKGKIKEND